MELPKPKRHISIWIISAVLVLILGFGFLLFGQRIADYFAGRDYEPTPELAKVIEKLHLTEDADLVLRAVHPVQQNAEDFNKNCPSGDEEMSTLGCFSPSASQIFIYQIDAEELDGIKESVLAHELLHAIYQRLNNFDRSTVHEALKDYYDAHRDEFEDYLSSYSEKLFYTELHSIVGQRVKGSDLPETLRNHYAKYFKNQDEIAGYYKKYRSVLETLEKNINALHDEVEKIRTGINERRAEYDQKLASYEKLSADFQKRSSEGAYSSYSEMMRAYDVVKDTYEKLEAERKILNKDIDALNEKINQLNDYVDRNRALSKAMDSHVKVEEVPTASAE